MKFDSNSLLLPRPAHYRPLRPGGRNDPGYIDPRGAIEDAKGASARNALLLKAYLGTTSGSLTTKLHSFGGATQLMASYQNCFV